MSLLPAFPLLVLAVAARAPSQQSVVETTGTVELSAVEAMHSGEARAIATLWERFGPLWREGARPWVPDDRVRDAVLAWLRGGFEDLEVVVREPIEVRDTTAGPAYRQAFSLRLDGPEARRFARAGTRRVERLNRTVSRRYLAIGAVWLLLLLGACRLDRATQGYLTGRIGTGALLLAILAAVLVQG